LQYNGDWCGVSSQHIVYMKYITDNVKSNWGAAEDMSE